MTSIVSSQHRRLVWRGVILGLIGCVMLHSFAIVACGQPPLEQRNGVIAVPSGAKPAQNVDREGPILLQPLVPSAPRGNAGMFIGVNEFLRERNINGLQCAVHDAVELAYLFVVELKLIPGKNCHLLLSGTPHAKVVQRHLEELKQSGAVVTDATRGTILETLLFVSEQGTQTTDLLVLSVSSHGFVHDRVPYVMPSDGRQRLLADTAVPLRAIEDKLSESKAGHRLLLVDACQERVAARGSLAAGEPMSAAFLDVFRTKTGQVKLASCSIGEFSYENDKLGGIGHGVFTFAFLEALRGGAKPDLENLVRLEAVSKYVAAMVVEWSKDARRKEQNPLCEGPELTRQLPLAIRGSDLDTLLSSIKRQATVGPFTVEMRDRLHGALSRIDVSREADRKLAGLTREFLAGRMSTDIFVPYLKEYLGGVPTQEPPLSPPEPIGNVPSLQEYELSLITKDVGKLPQGWKGDDSVAIRRSATGGLSVYPQAAGTVQLTRDDLTIVPGSFLEWTVYVGGWNAKTSLTLHGKDATRSVAFQVNRPEGNLPCVAQIAGLPGKSVGKFQDFKHLCRAELQDGVLRFIVDGIEISTQRVPERGFFQGITLHLSTADERHYGAEQNSSLLNLKLGRLH